MSIVEKYGKFIESTLIDHPRFAGRLLRIGLAYEKLRLYIKSGRIRTGKDDSVPYALNYLNRISISSVASALSDPGKTVWVNLFAPGEILSAFGLRPLSIECFSAFTGGFKIEDFFLRHAENLGMSDTLCSYHKCFIGAADTEILRPPLMSITTTLACDGNVNTFRFLEQRLGVKSFVIDVPYEYSKESLGYVAEQLYDLIALLEKLTGKCFDEAALKSAVMRENESRALQEEALALGASKKYPATLTLHMFKLFATHILSGSEEALKYYRLFMDDLRKYPDTDMIKIMWIHLMPYYQKTLKQYMGGEGKYQIICSDFDFDYGSGSRLNPENPVESIAEKLIRNIYNGPYSRKNEAALQAAKMLDIDGVIHFCHWGCKQSSGGAFEMKRVFDEAGIPFLILDGDGIDKRNDSPEQIRTRAEAFFEMLEGKAAEK